MSAEGKGRRILIVEDQRLIAADMQSTLQRLGYTVVGSVASGEHAVSAASEQHPDLILMDIRLSGKMDGIQAAAEIRQRSDVPIVYLTAYADEETVVRAKGTTPFGYIVKPFNERELRAAIEVAIYKHETDRVVAEERARRRAAEEFKLLVEGVKDYAIFLLDPGGRVMTWNEGAQRMKGYSAAEILGQHFSVFYPPDERAAIEVDQLLEKALREGRVELDGWRVRKDGSRFWANVIVSPVRDETGRLVGFGKISRDLTERRAAAERLAEQRRLLEAAFMDAPACICVLRGPEHVFELANPQYRALVGNRPIDGLPVRRALPELEAQGYFELLDRVYATGEPFFGTEMPAKLANADGSLRQMFINFVYQPIHSDRDTTDGIVTFGFDVTEQVLARRRVEELAGERARLVTELQAALQARDQFLQVASHELKTPLTPLQLQLDIVARSLEQAGVHNQKLWEKLEKAVRQTTRLNRLVDSLLDVSRITAGRLALQLETFDLAELLRDVVDRHRSEARGVASDIITDVPGPIHGRWDRLRVEQILTNLLTNAIKYGAGKPIEIEARVEEDAVRVEVTDHGIGIAEEAVARIFGRFERAVSVRHFGGLGLGLFIARHLAEAHGGAIAVRSREHVGSTFAVDLPLETAPASLPPPNLEQHRV